MTPSFGRGQCFSAWLDPRVQVHPSSIQGGGMFAAAPIRAGEVVLRWGGTIFNAEDLQMGKAKAGTAAQIADDLYIADPGDAPDSPDYCLNHSCDPNVWLADALTLTARREIAPGEELTADYALWEADPAWMLAPCRCGSPLCRGRVTGDDWRRPDLQARYAGHFTPFLNRKITG